jgi:hypothetical protein
MKGNQLPKTEAEWEWGKRYRVWDANRKVFLYPENWVEPELRLPSRFRVSLDEVAALICAKCDADAKRKGARRPAHQRGVRALLIGKSRESALVAAQILARDFGLDLYRIDLSSAVNKYIGETEKNLSRAFDAAEEANALLFFDEADALFGKRAEVKDSHDRYAKIEINYFLQQSEEYAGIAILAIDNRTKIDKKFSRRFQFVLRVPARRKARRK